MTDFKTEDELINYIKFNINKKWVDTEWYKRVLDYYVEYFLLRQNGLLKVTYDYYDGKNVLLEILK
jgi:hypothetical protein